MSDERRLMRMRPVKTIFIVDKGQDFLRWDVNPQGIVVACQPYQDWLWVGTIVLNHAELKRGSVIEIRTTSGEDTTLNYPCLKVRPI